MPTLVLPTVAVRESFVAAMAEFRAEGRGGPDDHSMIGRDLRESAGTWDTDEGFARYVASVIAETDRPPNGWVPSTSWWWVEGTEYLGRIAVRHELTDALRESGGHIGYDVRASARRRGHATAMLRAVLPLARELGVRPAALLTTDVTNIGSRAVIEACGGTLQDDRGGVCRYWVPTG
ncbi:GNAT family N-acetyltransferase [Actinomycetes bacterium KLBMP 9759]